MTNVLLFAMSYFINARNIRAVLVFVIGLAEMYVRSTDNDLDDQIVKQLRVALFSVNESEV